MVALLGTSHAWGKRKCPNQYPHWFFNNKTSFPEEWGLPQPGLLTETKQNVQPGMWNPKFETAALCLCHCTRSASLAASEGLAEASRAGFGGKGWAEPGSSTLISNLVHKDITRRYNSWEMLLTAFCQTDFTHLQPKPASPTPSQSHFNLHLVLTATKQGINHTTGSQMISF